jgi:D-glycero-D-manno-heptose 1,7-bisphosphate phosphatase
VSKLIILDRDGVINHDSDAFIKSADEWQPIEGSLLAIERLKQAGWKVAIATNQSGIRRGYYDRATLSSMHQKMLRLLQGVEVDWIAYSPYLSKDASPSRKPGIGMIRSIEQALNIQAKGCPFVGDTLSDVEAALKAQMNPYLVRTGKGNRTLSTQDECLESVLVYPNLLTVVESLL